MIGRPDSTEAAPYYFTYIDQVTSDDPLAVIESQLDGTVKLYSEISEERSLYRYAPDKWSIRQVLNHLTDTERSFAFRALWFARGFDTPLPSYDQNIGVAGAEADRIPLATHVEEFCRVRLATISLFRNLPPGAWMRRGIASDNPFTVRALAFITAGHVVHHNRIVRERYLASANAAQRSA
jgi:DinB superfamily